MIKLKNKRAIDKMRKAGAKLARIMELVGRLVEPGRSTLELDRFIEAEMRRCGLKFECKGYAGYPAVSCISLNDVVVHGVPAENVVLKDGDFVKIDVVGSYDGYCADMARYFFSGKENPAARSLANAAQSALDLAITLAVPGVHLSDLSHCVQSEVERRGFAVVREYAGHGIGRDMHEDPEILNYGKPGRGPVLQQGMTLALEPMVTERACRVTVASDGWSALTSDGCLAAHVEDTVLVTDSEPEVLTRLG